MQGTNHQTFPQNPHKQGINLHLYLIYQGRPLLLKNIFLKGLKGRRNCPDTFTRGTWHHMRMHEKWKWKQEVLRHPTGRRELLCFGRNIQTAGNRSRLCSWVFCTKITDKPCGGQPLQAIRLCGQNIRFLACCVAGSKYSPWCLQFWMCSGILDTTCDQI